MVEEKKKRNLVACLKEVDADQKSIEAGLERIKTQKK